ncbi:MAG: 16S rRNA (guanine(966)-N(2))-methyltransferase RsmD [Candidatus Omnitrophota bacterium]
MRITSGLLKSRLIREPRNIRPTQDKIRKALFDTVRAKVSDSYFLELFAGSGAVGIEALSNGAKEVILVEQDKRCSKIIRDNLSKLGLLDKDKASLNNVFALNINALKSIDIFFRNKKKFDIIFLDPPYYKDLAKKTLQKIAACDILAPSGLVIVEHNKKDILEQKYNNLTCFKQKRYGDIVLSFYEKID